ncbi:MAG: translation initiation factor IF-6 [Promethearchaeota archaeon]
MEPTRLFGTGTLGMFTSATDRFFIVPSIVKEREVAVLTRVFQVPPVSFNVWNTRLVGALVACNSNGILLPSQVLDEEVVLIRSQLKDLSLDDVRVGTIDSKDNALGNMILANDSGCVVSRRLGAFLDEIEQVLGVPSEVVSFAGTDLLGSAGLVNNNGGVIHPLADDDEIELTAAALKVPIDVSTVGCGIPFVGSCAAANVNGAVVNPETTGPELQRISEMLAL